MVSQLKISPAENTRTQLKTKKFAIVSSENIDTSELPKDSKAQFSSEWSQLEPDEFLQDGANFRFRRAGGFYFLPSDDVLIPYQPENYFQKAEINTYAGGMKRTFAPLSDQFRNNSFLQALIRLDFEQFPKENEKLSSSWRVGVHQIRITTSNEERGLPTPEGPHKDGVDFVAMHMINRHQVVGGVSDLFDEQDRLLAQVEMRNCMDSIFIVDQYIKHGVSPVLPAPGNTSGTRDVLLIGFSFNPLLEIPEPYNN